MKKTMKNHPRQVSAKNSSNFCIFSCYFYFFIVYERLKSRIKQNLPNFSIFIPSNLIPENVDPSNYVQIINDRNALQMLHNSCVKSNCQLEFEIKSKNSQNNVSTKRIITGDLAQFESDEEPSSAIKQKHK